MTEFLRLLCGLVELGAILGTIVFLTYGHGRWWGTP